MYFQNAIDIGVQAYLLDLPIGILGQVWYLIVSIPDIYTLTYFTEKNKVLFSIFKNCLK